MVLENLKPKMVWTIFENLVAKTPRESKHEALIRQQIRQWVVNKSKETNRKVHIFEDKIGNILIKVPARNAPENTNALMLQVHMDMVCETDRQEGFDFHNQPIPLRIQENMHWVDADGTTLGADDGIGIALVLALVFDENEFSHGPLEILLTVDEETGLTGAFNLDTDTLNITSKHMINIDSEDLGIITIGSAGGGDTKIYHNFAETDVLNDISSKEYLELHVSGLLGGHSGVDIHLPRANANKIIAQIMSRILNSGIEVNLCLWNGGTKRNAITRESKIKFTFDKTKKESVIQQLETAKQEIFEYYISAHPYEPKMVIEWTSGTPDSYITSKLSEQILRVANLIPQGVIRMSPAIPSLVETSNNFAIVKTTHQSIEFILSTRSNIDTELENLRQSIKDLSALSGLHIDLHDAYPGWKPEPENSFLKFIKKVYEKSLNSEIGVEAIHAGLETSIIGSKIPKISMVSIGPTVKNPHTPEEKVEIDSVEKIYNILRNIVSEFVHFE